MSNENKEFIRQNFPQPDHSNYRRKLEDNQEYVNYVEGSNVRIWHNVESDTYAMHHHDAIEIIICMENTYTVCSEDITYSLNKGDILIIPSHILHELIAPDTGSRFIFMYSDKIYMPLHDYNTIQPIFTTPYFLTVTSDPDIYYDIYSTLMDCVSDYFEHDIFWETAICSKLIKVMYIIGNNFYGKKTLLSVNPSKEEASYFETISYVLKYIDSNFSENLTLESVAEIIGFSKFYFSRMFKRYTNQTFYDYLSHRRIREAQSLLSKNVSVTEIALQTGFNSPTSFCRCFKKIAGCSPTEYRKYSQISLLK